MRNIGLKGNPEYFTLDKETRTLIHQVLWDEVYSDLYRQSYSTEHYGPLLVELDINDNLNLMLSQFETKEEYEVCDVLYGLLRVTPHKIHQIDLEYATNNPKTE